VIRLGSGPFRPGRAGGCGNLSARAPRAAQVGQSDQAADHDGCHHGCSDDPAASTLMPSRLVDQATTSRTRLLRNPRFDRGGHLSRHLVDDLNEFIGPISVMSGESDKFASSLEYRIASVGPAADGDAAASSEFHQSLVSERSQRPEHGVVVHSQHRGEVPGSREALAWLGVSLSDRTANLRCHLFVEWRLVGGVDSRRSHDASKASPISSGCPAPESPGPEGSGPAG